MTALRLVWRVARVALVVLFLYLGVTAVQVWMASRRDEAQRVEAIVVFGAAQYNGQPSPVLRARLDHAADLYRSGYADMVAVTGGRRPGDKFTEATASARYLAKRGVPDKSVLREVSSHNSWESLAASSVFLRKRGVEVVLLVSDPFHSARIAAMARELGLEAHTSPTRSSPISGIGTVPYLAKETVAVAAGRVIGFRRLMRVNGAVKRVREEALGWGR